MVNLWLKIEFPGEKESSSGYIRADSVDTTYHNTVIDLITQQKLIGWNTAEHFSGTKSEIEQLSGERVVNGIATETCESSQSCRLCKISTVQGSRF